MIRKTLEKGTKVFHRKYGFGTFEEFYDEMAIITFDVYPKQKVAAFRKNLTEIEDEI